MKKKKKVKGSSLFYAVILSLLIGVLLLSLTSLNFYKAVEFEIHKNSSEQISNCRSAQAILFSEYQNKAQDTWHKIYEFENPTFYNFSAWGLYFKGTSRSIILKDTLETTYLFGEKWSNDGVAVHLKNGISGLNISGRTLLVGNAAVPGGRIKPSFIENQSFQGNQLITGSVSEPKRPFPAISNKLLNSIKKLHPLNLAGNYTDLFSEISDSLKVDFNKESKIIYSSDSISLDGFKLEDNIIVCSRKALYVGGFCKAKNIIVSAPRIYISSDFKGAIQCFATKKTIVEEGAQLSYPSSLVLWGEDAEELVLEKDIEIQGNIILYSEDSKEATLEIESGTKITGVVYSNASSELKGSIHGQIITDEFFLITGSGFYKNYLLNAEVDVSKLPVWFSGLPLQGVKGRPILISK